MYTERGLPTLDGGRGTRAAEAVPVPELSTEDAGNGTLSGRTEEDISCAVECVAEDAGGPGVEAYIMLGNHLRRSGGVVSESKDESEAELLLSSEVSRLVYRPRFAAAGTGIGMVDTDSGEGERTAVLGCGGAT